MSIYQETNTGDIDFTTPDIGGPFSPLSLRIHFTSGNVGNVADVRVSLDAASGEEYDTDLYTIPNRGQDADCNLVWSADELKPPSPWVFQTGDRLRVRWTSPNNAIQWGLQLTTAGTNQPNFLEG
jgi:hypothetical protein